MLCLIACSVLTTGVVIERLHYYWNRRDNPNDTLATAVTRLRAGETKEAVWACRNAGHPMGVVAAHVLEQRGLSASEIEEKMQVALSEQKLLLAWKGLTLGEDGYVTLTFEYKDQARTERDGYDVRQQYPLVNGAFDSRESTFERFNAWFGEPELEQLTLFANFGMDLSSGAHAYGWASFQDRNAESAGFYRRALGARNVIEIYPDGFLPIIAPRVTEASVAFGVAWNWGEWAMDSSLVYGYNKMEFTIENTLNRALGTASGTEFDAGGFDYDQAVFNFSGVRGFGRGDRSLPHLQLGTGKCACP